MQREVWGRCTTTNQMEINTYMKFNASQDSRCLLFVARLVTSRAVPHLPPVAPPPLQLHHAGPNMAEAAAAAAAALAVVTALKNVAK